MRYLIFLLIPNILFASLLFPQSGEFNLGIGLASKTTFDKNSLTSIIPLTSFNYNNIKHRGSQVKYYMGNFFMKLNLRGEKFSTLDHSTKNALFYGVGQTFKYGQLTAEYDPLNHRRYTIAAATSIPFNQYIRIIPKIEYISRHYIDHYFNQDRYKINSSLTYSFMISSDINIYNKYNLFNIIGYRFLNKSVVNEDQKFIILGIYHKFK